MDYNNFNHLNIPSNSDGTSNTQPFLLSDFSFLCDVDDFHFDSLSTFDFTPSENLDSSTLAQDINDFTDLLLEYEPNQFEFSFPATINDFPPLLSPDLSPSQYPSSQIYQDIPQLTLPTPSIQSSNIITEQTSSIRRFDLKIPQLPFTTTNSLEPRTETEQKKVYRQKKLLKYLQKKRLRNKLKNIDPNVRYHSRQTAASKRQRINGKFARECPVFIPANKF